MAGPVFSEFIIIDEIMGTENVKERLNTLLHKKIIEQEKDGKSSTATDTLSIKTEVDVDRNTKKTQHQIDSPEIQQDNSLESGTLKDEMKKTFLLHEILSEKKKVLMQDKEVIAFFQDKINK